jgi:hypothetical protein
LKLLIRNALVVLALTLPIAALADVTGTQTLSAGNTLSLDTGKIGTTGDVTWTGTAIMVFGSATDVDLASTPASAFSGQEGFTELVEEGQALIAEFSAEFGSYLATKAITPSLNDILVVQRLHHLAIRHLRRIDHYHAASQRTHHHFVAK